MFVLIIKKNRLTPVIIALAATILLFCIGISFLIKHYSSATANNESKYIILVQIDEKRLYLFENGEIIKKYPIASGKPGWPSPIGNWKIIDKGNWGDGFGGRWMGLNVRWGNYGIHGTLIRSSIGRAASHGCIRMFNKDVKELYDIVSVGTPVIIRNGPFGPFGTGFRQMAPGDRGADVLAIQERLKSLGYFKGYPSGIYEDDLKEAIYKFQKDKGLKIKYTLTKPDYNAMGFYEFE